MKKIFLLALFILGFCVSVNAQDSLRAEQPLSIQEALHVMLGQRGSVLISTADSTFTGYWAWVECLSDSAVIDTLIDTGRSGETFDTLTVYKGQRLYGKNIKSIRLNSGKVIAYRKVE